MTEQKISEQDPSVVAAAKAHGAEPLSVCIELRRLNGEQLPAVRFAPGRAARKAARALHSGECIEPEAAPEEQGQVVTYEDTITVGGKPDTLNVSAVVDEAPPTHTKKKTRRSKRKGQCLSEATATPASGDADAVEAQAQAQPQPTEEDEVQDLGALDHLIHLGGALQD